MTARGTTASCTSQAQATTSLFRAQESSAASQRDTASAKQATDKQGVRSRGVVLIRIVGRTTVRWPTQQNLAMPKRAHYIIVDGHSIIFAWPELRKLHARRSSLAREALIKQLRGYQDWTGVHVVVVFDGKGSKIDRLRCKCFIPEPVRRPTPSSSDWRANTRDNSS